MITLLVESWSWYGIVCLIFIGRFVSRWLQLGSVTSYQIDDYIMIAVFTFYSTLIGVINEVAHLSSNLMTAEEVATLTPESTASRIHGSKLVLVVEQSMIMTTWGCKLGLLCMYSRLTAGLMKRRWAIKFLGFYIIATWIIMETLYFGVWCRPFSQYWAVPVDNIQCSTALHHLIVNAVFNISSDLMMLFVPLPILIEAQLPRGKKFVLCMLFSLGVFVILSAALNKYYSFRHPFGSQWTYWYVREASTAILVANIPMSWSLLRRLFNLRAFINSTQNNRSRTGTSSTLGKERSPYARSPDKCGGIRRQGSDEHMLDPWETLDTPAVPLKNLPCGNTDLDVEFVAADWAVFKLGLKNEQHNANGIWVDSKTTSTSSQKDSDAAASR